MRTKRQRELLQASLDIVGYDGFSKLTIRNIAARVGVTEPAVYRHFGSKLELLTALLEDIQATAATHFHKLTAESEQETELKPLLSRFIHGLFKDLTAHPAYASFLFSEEVFHIQPETRPLMAKIMQENMTVLAASIEKLQQKGLCRNDLSPMDLSPVLMGSIRFMVSRWNVNRETKQAEALCGSFSSTMAHLFAHPAGFGSAGSPGGRGIPADHKGARKFPGKG